MQQKRKIKASRQRLGDHFVEVKVSTYSAIVPWQTLLDAVRIEPDAYGVDNETMQMFNGPFELVDPPDGFAAGAMRRSFQAVWADNGWRLIKFPKPAVPAGRRPRDDRGRSRQVAAEEDAADRVRDLELIGDWIDGDLQRYNFSLVYEGREANTSIDLIGAPDATENEDSVAQLVGELAREVAAALKEAGFTISDEPDWDGEYWLQRYDSMRRRIGQMCPVRSIRPYRGP